MLVPSRGWVRGLADRSCQIIGGLDSNGEPISPAIVMTSKGGSVLMAAGGFLRSIDIGCKVSWKKARCTLRVGGVDALKKWRDEIGFLDSEKTRQLDEVLRVTN